MAWSELFLFTSSNMDLWISICMLGNFSRFCYRLPTFFKIIFFKKFFQDNYQSVKLFWIQIRTDVLSVLIWVQAVCKGYQQKMKSQC